MTPSRSKKRRNSGQGSKIIVKTTDNDETLRILPGVLLSFNEKFINIGGTTEKPDKAKEVEPSESADKAQEVDRVYMFRARTDSMKSIDI